MKIANNRFMLKHLKINNPQWFTRENKRFFNDKEYYFMYSITGKPFLVRSTFAWSDMFGNEPKLHFRLNNLKDDQENNGDYKIGNLIEDIFNSLGEVKAWLGNH